MLRDLQYGFRQLRRNQFFSGVVIVLLALGIGANTLVFSLVNELLLKPLPVRNPQNLFLVEKMREKQVRPDVDFEYRALLDIFQKNPLFPAAVAEEDVVAGAVAALDAGGPVRLVTTQMVSPNYFSELGVKAEAGRVLTEADAANGGTIPLMLSHQFWESEFSGDRGVIGRTVRIKGFPFVIAGVLPKEFHSSDIDRAPDVRLPISAAPVIYGYAITEPHGDRRLGFRILARLAPGVSPAHAASAVLADVQSNEVWSQRESYARSGLPVTPALLERETWAADIHLELLAVGRGVSQLRDQFSRALWLLLGGVALLLLAVCANVAGLLLAKSDQRRREIGIRVSVGAGRAHLIRQLMTENLLLAIPGAVLGAVLAYAATPPVVALLPAPRDFAQFRSPQILAIAPDARVLLFTAVVAALCVLTFGLAPAWRGAGQAISTEFKATARRGHRSLAALAPVSLQVAFCVVLLAAAALMLRTFWKLENLDPGFDRAHIVQFTVDPMDVGYTKAQSGAYYREVKQRVARLPGVRSVAYAARGVMRGVGMKTTLAPQGVVLPKSTFLNTSSNAVTPEYFETMGMPLLTGRNLQLSDAPKKLVPIVVNQAFADYFFARRNPVGKRMTMGTDGNQPPWQEIVGLTVTAKYRSMREPDPPTYYSVVDESQGSEYPMLLYVRTYGDPSTIIHAVREVLTKVDPAVPLVETLTIEEEIQSSLWQEHLVALLSAFFGGVSVLLAAIGLYGALTYSVAQRTHELGIRVAVGARMRHVVQTVCSPIAVAVLCGLCGGLLAAASLLRVTERLLYGVPALDPASFAAAGFLVVTIGGAAAAIPAWRAARIDPSLALRKE